MGELDEPETTWDLRVALEWGEWVDADGDRVRLRAVADVVSRGPATEPFEYLLDDSCWEPMSVAEFTFPLRRYVPPTKPAPATLGDVVVAWAMSGANSATHCKRGTGQALRVAELRVTMLGKPDLEANDWLVSTDGGKTWASPNGTVDE